MLSIEDDATKEHESVPQFSGAGWFGSLNDFLSALLLLLLPIQTSFFAWQLKQYQSRLLDVRCKEFPR